MKQMLLMVALSVVLSGCVNNGKKMIGDNRPIAPIVTEEHSSQETLAKKQPDAVSHGAGENERITELSPGESAAQTKQANSAIYLFDFDDSKIHEEYKNDLSQHAKYLLEHPNAKLLLAGHTDEIGSREYNVALGERRAKSILDYLKFAGVNPAQLRLISYGQEKPRALGHNQDAYRLNRRVELSYEVV